MNYVGGGRYVLWHLEIVLDVKDLYRVTWWICGVSGGLTWVVGFVVTSDGVLFICRVVEGK